MNLSDFSERWVSVPAINDPDGVMLAAAASTEEQVFDVADFDGAVIVAGKLRLARRLTFTTEAGVGEWALDDPIVVVGSFNGAAVTEEVELTATGGGETLRTVNAYDAITSVTLPLQPGTSDFSIGVSDVVFQPARLPRAIKPLADGYLHCKQTSAGSNLLDALPVKAGIIEHIRPAEVSGDTTLSNPTNTGFIVYF